MEVAVEQSSFDGWASKVGLRKRGLKSRWRRMTIVVRRTHRFPIVETPLEIPGSQWLIPIASGHPEWI